MKKSLLFFFALSALLLVFQACNDVKPPTTPVDEEFPEIIMTSPTPGPIGQYNYYTSADSVIIDITFEDDVELDRYDITLSYRQDLYYFKTNNFPWFRNWHGSLEGQNGGFNHVEYVVYDPTAGPYELVVKVWDAEGNVTETVAYLFVTNLNDPSKPVVNITNPSPVDTFSIGQQLPIRATMTDNDVVVGTYARLRNPVTKEMMAGSEITLDSIWLPSYILDSFVNVPAGTTPGDYLVEVFTHDNVFNVGTDTVRVFIRP